MSFKCVGCSVEKEEYGFKLPNGLLICDACFGLIELPPPLIVSETTPCATITFDHFWRSPLLDQPSDSGDGGGDFPTIDQINFKLIC